MGESKRRQKLDPDYGKPVDLPVTSTYGDSQDRNRFIEPGFDVAKFDINQSHTIKDWESYFFSINPDSVPVDNLVNNPVVKMNLHSNAFLVYLAKKTLKGLVTNFSHSPRSRQWAKQYLKQNRD